MPTPANAPTAEHARLLENHARTANWQRWGPYLPERQWGTVREDYSATSDSWRYFTHDHARSRAYRWGDDGLLGWCDRQCRLCFAVALWNGRDPILKERLFGLTGPEGNHGEDVKEVYHYLDSTPTHSYAKAMYRYPQAAFPYDELVKENRLRSRLEPEYEIEDTGVFAEGRYFDVVVEYAKASPDDTLIRITCHNRGPEAADLHVLPTFWFRNTWIWGCRHEGCGLKPAVSVAEAPDAGIEAFTTRHETLPEFCGAFNAPPAPGDAPLLFTENETNSERLYKKPSYTPYVKDAFHRWVIDGETDAVNPKLRGTKVARAYRMTIPAGGQRVIEARLRPNDGEIATPFGPEFDEVFNRRINEAQAFYAATIPAGVEEEPRGVSRQAYGGLLWTKQFYHYIVGDWLEGDRDVATPPASRREGRNHHWGHVYARDVLSIPDKWEYPWFAAWDLAFHMIPMARVDPEFAKSQLLLLLREWYLHPNGQLPAYEFALDDVNPPVHAWACLRVYQMTAENGARDHDFLARAFQRLLLNFTWWVNQVDDGGNNVFAGGFLGLDNIGVFDRSKGLPTGAKLEQADGTAWMAFYCGTMLSIAIELARVDPSYQEMASKFLDHFVRITDAINRTDGAGLWDASDGFYYDRLHVDGQAVPMRVRSLVGLMPLIAVAVLDKPLVESLPAFRDKLKWFLTYRHGLVKHIAMAKRGGGRMLLAIPSEDQLRRVLRVMLDEDEFLSPYGVRSLSKRHAEEPFEIEVRGERHRVAYVPGESDSWMFGGNSNWRGPVWFPVNYLLIEALERYHAYYEGDMRVECPTGSGNLMTLAEVASEINRRLTNLFGAGSPNGVPGEPQLFHEYFHADTGEGLGASHQTGWTALIANCIEKSTGRSDA